MTVTPEEARSMEALTREQHMCPAWMQLRYGRITASIFGDACRTRLDQPSVSLLDKILQIKSTPDVEAIKWGRQMEGAARGAYAAVMQQYHTKWTCSPSGLVLSPTYPHLGASPDGIVQCDCCGKGTIEIKCPFSKRKVDPCCDPPKCMNAHKKFHSVVAFVVGVGLSSCFQGCGPLNEHFSAVYDDFGLGKILIPETFRQLHEVRLWPHDKAPNYFMHGRQPAMEHTRNCCIPSIKAVGQVTHA